MDEDYQKDPQRPWFIFETEPFTGVAGFLWKGHADYVKMLLSGLFPERTYQLRRQACGPSLGMEPRPWGKFKYCEEIDCEWLLDSDGNYFAFRHSTHQEEVNNYRRMEALRNFLY